MIAALAFVFIPWNVRAQDSREIEIRKNVKLVEMALPTDIPSDIAGQYRSFLPILEQSLKDATTDQSDECAITFRVSAGIKEVGAAKVKRPLANVTAFRRNSKQEYLGSFILYSYINAGPVNKEETSQFLKKQILEPAGECRKTE
jgi:hypothetical protein